MDIPCPECRGSRYGKQAKLIRYTNKDGVRVYTTDIIVEEQEFAESKAASDRNSSDFAANNNYGGGYQQSGRPVPSQAPSDGFMNIPDGIDEELPFS